MINVNLLLKNNAWQRTHDLRVVVVCVDFIKNVIYEDPERNKVLKPNGSLNCSNEIKIIVDYHSLWIKENFLESLLPYLVVSDKRVKDRAWANKVINHPISKGVFDRLCIVQANVTETFSIKDLLGLEE